MPNNQTKTTSTKNFVQVAEIRDGMVVLKDGSLRAVVEVGAMNFELKSIDEQTAVIKRFQDFLNSIDFSIQIVASSRRLNIAPYLKSLEELQVSIQNELLKIQAAEYTRFVKGLTELANIMAKKFYVVVPYYATPVIESPRGFFETVRSAFGSSKTVKKLSDQELESHRVQLNQRIAVILEGLSGLGIETKILNKEDLLSLLYSHYNPGQHP